MRFAMIIGLVNLFVLAGCGTYEAEKVAREIRVNFYNEVMSDGELLTQEDKKSITVSYVRFNGIVFTCIHWKLIKDNEHIKQCK